MATNGVADAREEEKEEQEELWWLPNLGLNTLLSLAWP